MGAITLIKYQILSATFSFIIFMVWMFTSDLPGGEIGMAPFELLYSLFFQLVIGATLSAVFNKYLKTVTTLIIGICTCTLFYEFILPPKEGSLVIMGIFQEGSKGEINRAFALIPIVAMLATIVVIIVKEGKPMRSGTSD